MSDLNQLLSIPPSFAKQALKLGWNTLNFKVTGTSVYLTQDNFRLSYQKVNDSKFWKLECYSPSGGWHDIHLMIHPGTSRLDWVLKTSNQVMQSFSEGPPPKKPATRSTTKKK